MAALPFALILAPIGSFLVLSLFFAEKHQIIHHVTFFNYVNFFGNWTYLGTFLGTLLLCLEVMALSLMLGYPIAWFIWRQKGSRRYLLLLLAVVPLFMSYIVKFTPCAPCSASTGWSTSCYWASAFLKSPADFPF